MDGELILITIAWGLSLQFLFFYFFYLHILYDFPNFQDHYLLLFLVINLPSYIKILLHMWKHQIPCQCSIGWFRPLSLSLMYFFFFSFDYKSLLCTYMPKELDDDPIIFLSWEVEILIDLDLMN